MRRRWRYFRLFGLMSILFAIALGIYFGVRRSPQEVPSTTEPARVRSYVIVAAQDILPRTLITPEQLEEREVPAVPEGAFTTKEAVVSRLALTLIRRGEPLFQQHVSPPLKTLSAAYLIPSGQIGMALTVTRRDLVPPLRSGDYVAIHASFAGLRVRTIVPRALVLAVDNRIGNLVLPAAGQEESQPPSRPTGAQQPPTPPKESVVLFVSLSPQEAKGVMLALEAGATLYYTLHSAPLPPLLPPGLERDMTLGEVVGSPTVEALLLRKQHGEAAAPAAKPVSPPPSPQPVVVEPMVARLQQLGQSVQHLQARVTQLERHPPPVRPKPTPRERQVIGVLGDQKVTFQLPLTDGGEGR